MRNLLLALALTSSAAVLAQSPASATRLVGDFGLSLDQLATRIYGVGVIAGQDDRGFYRVQAIGDASSLDARLRGLSFVLPGGANRVDRRRAGSMLDYADYLVAAHTLQHRQAPTPFDLQRLGVNALRNGAAELSIRSERGTGELNRWAYRAAADQREAMQPAQRWMLDTGATGPQSYAPVAWAFCGPKSHNPPSQGYYGEGVVSGRKNAVAISVSTPTTSYVASAGGGAWKSIDNGVTYTPLSDRWPALYTSSVAIDPGNANVVYIGTGDRNGAMTTGFGVMKSTDGGATWTQTGLGAFGTSTITKLWIHPTNPSVVLAAAEGGSNPGIYRSADSGDTWVQTNAPAVSWQDLDAAANGSVIYAVSPTAGLFSSTTAGATWNAVGTPIPTGADGTIWDIGVSKLDSSRVYMVMNGSKFFKTNTGGATWDDITAVFDEDMGGWQNWAYGYGALFVDTGVNVQGDNDLIVTGMSTVGISQDGGGTWKDVSFSMSGDAKCHFGQFSAAFYPGVKGKFSIVSYGGLNRVTLDASSNAIWENLNGSFADSLTNVVTVHPIDPLSILAGTKKNGAAASRGAGSNTPWAGLFGWDVGGVAFDRFSPGVHYTGTSGLVYRYTSANDPNPDLLLATSAFLDAPFAMGGATGSDLLVGIDGTLKVYNNAFWTDRPTGGSLIRAICPSRHAPNTVFTGSTVGEIYRTNNLGASFTRIDGDLPDVSVGGMEESPSNPGVLFAGLQRVGVNGTLYHTANANVDNPVWTNRSGSGATALPPVPVNDVAHDPFNNTIYAATDVGVFVSPNLGVNWYNMNSLGLPNVRVNDLWVYSANGVNFLYAATDGRGVWRCFLSQRSVTQVQIAKPRMYGGHQNTVTIKLNGSAPPGSVVVLSDTSPWVSVPSSVTIPQGSTQVTFNIFSTNPDRDHIETITAKAWGSTMTGSFTVYAVPNFTYTPENQDIFGGNKFTATVDLGIDAPLTTVITFSDNSALVSSPASTSIPEGGRTKAVTLHTTTVTSTTNTSITAKIANTSRTSSVTLQPRPDLASISVDPAIIKGGEGSVGRVAMNYTGYASTQIVNISDSSSVVTSWNQVGVMPGSIDAYFPIRTTAVTTTYNVTMKATLRNVTRTCVLTVTP